MTITKDNITDYQISHIDSTHEERLEVCRILESFGQKQVLLTLKMNLLIKCLKGIFST